MEAILCSEASVVKSGLDGYQAVTLKCRSWGCPLCQDDRQRQLVGLARGGKPDTFITLTSNPRTERSPALRARALAHAWRKIVRLAKRRYGYKSIPYLCVFEATKRGEPHLHILARVKWIDQRWLSKQMASHTGAPVVDIRRVKSSKEIASYISKYIGKEPHRFATCKRYWTTRDWTLAKFEPEAIEGRWKGDWRVYERTIDDFEAEWRAGGLDVTRTRYRVVARGQGPPDDEWQAYLEVLRGRYAA